MESAASAVTNRLDPQDVVVLALVSVPNDDRREKIIVEGNAVILDVEALKPSELKTADDMEKYERRVDRESMRAIGGLLGLASCPNPTCALYRHRSEEELDRKGRNFCPPCCIRAMEILRKEGVQAVQ
jgi:predicted Zn-dependent protease